MVEKSTSISAIMPAFNEEAEVERVALYNMETFNQLGIDFEILIINDSSIDQTGKLAMKLADQYPDIKYFEHPINMGIGAAFKTGIEHAKKEYVMFLPFDNPIDPEDLMAYRPYLGICDIISGVRIERIGYTRWARFASFVYNRILIPLIFNIGISDVNWIQIYRRRLFAENIINFSISRIFFLVEILVQAKRKRLIMVEVPSKMRQRVHGKPTCTRFSVIIETLFSMLRFFLKLRKENI